MSVTYKEFQGLSQNELDIALIDACEDGHFDKVKYLLTSPELTTHANIRARKDAPLITACGYNNVEIIKYLLTSEELKEHANIHAQADAPFLRAMQRDNWDLVKYYIFDLNIEKNESIRCYYDLFPKEQDKLNNWFKIRDLGQELEEKLSAENTPNKTKKIKL